MARGESPLSIVWPLVAPERPPSPSFFFAPQFAASAKKWRSRDFWNEHGRSVQRATKLVERRNRKYQKCSSTRQGPFLTCFGVFFGILSFMRNSDEFGRIRDFSDRFGLFRTDSKVSDEFWYFRTSSDNFGQVRTFSDKFGFFGQIWIFRKNSKNTDIFGFRKRRRNFGAG